MARRISKVKLKRGDVEIHFEDQLNPKTWAESTFQSTEDPHPDFVNAMRDLVGIVYDILAWPRDLYANAVHVSSVSFSESDGGIKGAVLTGYVELETANSPFNFNTPHMPYQQYSPTGNSPTMAEKDVRRLNKVEDEAKEYLKGRRAQLDLPGVRK